MKLKLYIIIHILCKNILVMSLFTVKNFPYEVCIGEGCIISLQPSSIIFSCLTIYSNPLTRTKGTSDRNHECLVIGPHRHIKSFQYSFPVVRASTGESPAPRITPPVSLKHRSRFTDFDVVMITHLRTARLFDSPGHQEYHRSDSSPGLVSTSPSLRGVPN